MKVNQIVLLFLFLALGVAASQDTNSASPITNSGTFAEMKSLAEKGVAEAQYNLGLMYYNGQGVGTNYVEAAKWYRNAAEQGNSDAQLNLGYCYYEGDGVELNHSEAAKWYRKAAEQGSIKAQDNLGKIYTIPYEPGKGVVQDYIEAVKWYNRAAEQGDLIAQSILGSIYYDGMGVPKNNIEAYKWLNLVSAHTGRDENERELIESAKTIRNKMVELGQITPEEVAEAQRLSAAFVPRKETPGSSSANPISTSPESPIASGTGFFITEDGFFVTCTHVVKDAGKVRVVTSAGTISAKVVQVDAANDLALLKADGKFYALPIAPSRKVQLGSTVATVGFPDPGLQGFSPKLAKGEIAALAGAGDDARYFQISVPVQPGNSGGALVDEHGNVVGIVSAKLNASAALAASGALPENVNYAIKSSYLLSFLESVPDVSAKLKDPLTADRKFEDVVKSAQDAAVLVLVY